MSEPAFVFLVGLGSVTLLLCSAGVGWLAGVEAKERMRSALERAPLWRAIWDDLPRGSKAECRQFFEQFRILPPHVSHREGWAMNERGIIADVDLIRRVKSGD